MSELKQAIAYLEDGIRETDNILAECSPALQAKLLVQRGHYEVAIQAMRRTQPDITGETSDGYHTFNELYHHRAVLFSVICNTRPEIAWKSKQHHDGTMYDGMFIVGINTPDGQATYHYDAEPYWEMFRVKELPNAPEWDGHTPTQAIERIGKLSAQPDNAPLTLEELRGMDGEPVYITDEKNHFNDRWVISDRWDADFNEFCSADGSAWSDYDYGKTWFAYRRKPDPEGGDRCGL